MDGSTYGRGGGWRRCHDHLGEILEGRTTGEGILQAQGGQALYFVQCAAAKQSLLTYVDQFPDVQVFQLIGKRLQGRDGAPRIAVWIRQFAGSLLECLYGAEQPFQFVDRCLELRVRHSFADPKAEETTRVPPVSASSSSRVDSTMRGSSISFVTRESNA